MYGDRTIPQKSPLFLRPTIHPPTNEADKRGRHIFPWPTGSRAKPPRQDGAGTRLRLPPSLEWRRSIGVRKV